MDEWFGRAAGFFQWLSEAWVHAPERLGFPPEWLIYGALAAYVVRSLSRSRARARRAAAAAAGDPRQLSGGASGAAAAGQPSPYLDAIREKSDLATFMDTMADEARAAGPKPDAAPRRVDVRRLAPAPRRLSPVLAVRVFFGGMQQAGWLIFGFGTLFAVALVGKVELAWSLRAGTVGQADGLALEYFETGSAENEVSVYGTRYVFELSGEPVEGVSYATGRYLTPGEAARVEYDLDDPRRSRIIGMRSAEFGPVVLLVLLFPAVGVLLIAFSIPRRLRELRLLRNGELAFGRLVEASPTNTYVNKQRVYELRFEFKARDGRTATASTMTHRPDEFEDEVEEALLYDPSDPTRNVMFDAMPGRPRVSSDGALSTGLGGALGVLVLPALALGGNGLLAWLKWGA